MNRPLTRLAIEALENRTVPSWTITDLGTLVASDINGAGQIVGTSGNAAGEQRAFLWQNGVMTDLGTLGGSSDAYGINDLGQVVGRTVTVDPDIYHAFLLTPEDTDGNGAPDRWFRDTNSDGKNDLMLDLGALGGVSGSSVAEDVNNLGQVVGRSAAPGAAVRAVIWQNGAITDLGTGSFSEARAINDTGVVTGVYLAGGEYRAFLWRNGTVTNVGPSNGGNDINGTGQFVDTSSAYIGRLWTPTVPNGATGTFRDLGYLAPSEPGWGWSTLPYGLNNVGQVVGNSPMIEPFEGWAFDRGFLWNNGLMEELQLNIAWAINDSGQIVGMRRDQLGSERSYLLTPWPADLPHVTITGGSVTEGNSGATRIDFTVRLSIPSSEVVTVDYATRDGAAAAPSDYTATSGRLMFAPGETSKVVSVVVLDDRLPEGDDSFSVVLSNAVNAYIISESATGVIADNEPRISAGGIVVEGNDGLVGRFIRISLSNAYDLPVSVDFATADDPNGYAIAGSDYLPASGTITIAPGDTVYDAPITIVGDRVPEYYFTYDGFWTKTEYFNVILSNPSDHASAYTAPGRFWIEDDEPLISVNSFVSVTEGDAGNPSAVFTVTLSTAYPDDVTVNYMTFDGMFGHPYDAEAGKDYVATSGTLRFLAGETSKTVSVPILDDNLGENWEYFHFNLSDPSSNAALNPAMNQGLGEIVDYDPPPLSISDASRTEGNVGTIAIEFTVSLSWASNETVTVHFDTVNGTAAAGSDFQTAAGTLTFAPGETSKNIVVLVNGDRVHEPNETLFVNLSSPTNAAIAHGQGVGIIVDDEPRVSISDVSKSEGKKGKTTLFTFTVTLSAAYDQPVTMSYRTVNGTASTSDNDYIAKTGTLAFAPGETTKTITITVKGDSKREGNETFYLDLSGLSSNGLFSKSRGIGTILNDD